MRLIGDPLRLAEAAVEAALVLTVVLAPYRSYALDGGHRMAVSAGVLAGLAVAVYALHAVTFDHFRLTGHRRWGPAADPRGYTHREE